MPIFGETVQNTNEIDNQGNNNLIMQGITVKEGDVNVTYSTINEAELAAKIIETMGVLDKKRIDVFVLTTTAKQLATKGITTDRHGNKLSDWCLFAETKNGQTEQHTVETLLSKANQDKYRCEVKIYYLDCCNTDITDFQWATFKQIRRWSVFVLDPATLHFLPNKLMSEVFDDPCVGGCILPICENLKNIKSYKAALGKDFFKNLHLYYTHNDFDGKIDCDFIHLQNVTDANVFRKNLQSIVKRIDANRKSVNTDLQSITP
jgi:hypothetical protein